MSTLPNYMQSKTAWSLLGTRVGVYRIASTSVAELNRICIYILRDIINLANNYRIGAGRITLTINDIQRGLLKRNTPIFAGSSKEQFDEALPRARCAVIRGFVKDIGLRRKILAQTHCFYLVPTKFRRLIRFILDNTNTGDVRFGNLAGRMLQLYTEHKMGEVMYVANTMAIDKGKQTITPTLLRTAFMKIWRIYNLKDIHWRTLPPITGELPKDGKPSDKPEEEEEFEEEDEPEEEEEEDIDEFEPDIDEDEEKIGDLEPFSRPIIPRGRKKRTRPDIFRIDDKDEPFVPFQYRPQIEPPAPLPAIMPPPPPPSPEIPFDKPKLPKRRGKRKKPIFERKEEPKAIEPPEEEEEDIDISDLGDIGLIRKTKGKPKQPIIPKPRAILPKIDEEPPILPIIPDEPPPLPPIVEPGPRRFVKAKRRLPPAPPSPPISEFRFNRDELKEIEDDMKDQGINFKFDLSEIKSIEEKENERKQAEKEASEQKMFELSLEEIQEQKDIDEIIRKIASQEDLDKLRRDIEDQIVDDYKRAEELRNAEFNAQIKDMGKRDNDDLRRLADELQKSKIAQDEIEYEQQQMMKRQAKEMDDALQDYLYKEQLKKKRIDIEDNIIRNIFEFDVREERMLSEEIETMRQRQISELNIIADEIQAAKIKSDEKNAMLNEQAINTLLQIENEKRRLAIEKHKIITDEINRMEEQIMKERKQINEKEDQLIREDIKRMENIIAEEERKKEEADEDEDVDMIINSTTTIIEAERELVDLKDDLDDIEMEEEKQIIFKRPDLPKRRPRSKRRLYPREEEKMQIEETPITTIVRRRGKKRPPSVPVEEAELELRPIFKPLKKRAKLEEKETRRTKRKSKKAQIKFKKKMQKMSKMISKQLDDERKQRESELSRKRDEIMQRSQQIVEEQKAKEMEEVVEEEKKIEEPAETTGTDAMQKFLEEMREFKQTQRAAKEKMLRESQELLERMNAKKLQKKRDAILKRSKEIEAEQKRLKKQEIKKFGKPPIFPRRPKTRRIQKPIRTGKHRPTAEEERRMVLIPKKKEKRGIKRKAPFSAEEESQRMAFPRRTKRMRWSDIERVTRIKKPSARVLKSRASYEEQQRLLEHDESLLQLLLEDIEERSRVMEAQATRPGIKRTQRKRTAPTPVQKAELEARKQFGHPKAFKRQRQKLEGPYSPFQLEAAKKAKEKKDKEARRAQKIYQRIKKDIERRSKRRKKKK